MDGTMRIILKDARELAQMREAGRVVSAVLDAMTDDGPYLPTAA